MKTPEQQPQIPESERMELAQQADSESEKTKNEELVDIDSLKQIKALGLRKNKDTLGRLVGIYRTSSQQHYELLKKSIANKDIEETISVAHPFKSSSAQLGATPLKLVLAEIEGLAREASENGGEWNPLIDEKLIKVNSLYDNTLNILLDEANLS